MAAGPRETGSNVHSIMVDAASRPQVDRKQVKVFKKMFKKIEDSHIKAFLTIVSTYKADDSLEARMSTCILMQHVIREVRKEGYQDTYPKTEVDVSCLTTTEFTHIIKIVDIIKRKTQAQRGLSEESAGPIMLADLMSDLEIAAFSDTRLPKRKNRSTPPFITKMKQVAIGQNCEGRFRELLVKAGPIGWEEDWDINKETRSGAQNSTNVFNVDHMFLFAIYCKAAQMSLAMTMRFAESLALFSMMRNIGRESQKSYWRSHLEYRYIRAFMHETFEGLHDSPFKLTFTRCLRAVTCLMPTASDVAPLYVQDKKIGLKMVAKICAFQELSGDIRTEAMTTSTSEHLIHQLLLSGMDGTLHMKKNGLRGSALYKVSFKFDENADHVGAYQVVKMTPKLCKSFKEKSSKITEDSKNEKDVISEEFFKKVMGNSFNPGLVGLSVDQVAT